MKEHIVLIGMPGAGKSTIGNRLKDALDMPLVDMDTAIELDNNLSVFQIFKLYGESYFRDLEATMLARILQGPPHIIATGGGIVLREANQLLLRELLVIYIKRDLLAIEKENLDNRPLLAFNTPAERRQALVEMEKKRGPLYEALATFTMDMGKDSLEETAIKQMVEKIREGIDENNGD